MSSDPHPYQEILDLLSEQFTRNTSAIAVISHNSCFHTYSDLESRVSKVNKFLSHLGASSKHVVAICAEQDISYITALLGVITHGCVFLNLDLHTAPNAMMETLAFSPPDILIVDQHFPNAILSQGYPIVFIESILDGLTPAFSLEAPSHAEFDTDVMHLIYTSGYTDIPKCVMGSYTAILNRFCWNWQQFPFVSSDVLCCQTSPAFTDFLWTSLGGLLVGTPTIFVPKHTFMNTTLFLHLLHTHSVTHLTVVPSFLRKMNRILNRKGKSSFSLKFLVSTGELLHDFIAKEFLTYLPTCTLVNLYGSTETASDVTFYIVNLDSISEVGVPIGRAITGVSCYIMDASGDLVKEPYVVGELLATGDCLSHGYYKNPELTQRRFGPVFLSADKGAVEGFRTGDLVSWLPNGDLEFVGRTDEQVKIAGFRCDLKEIETVLLKIAFVERVLVRVVVFSKDMPQLVAFIQLDPGSISISDCPPFWKDTSRQKQIRSLIAKTVPSYMIPSICIFVKQFPLLHSGKIDMKSLPDPSKLNWEDEIETPQFQIENEILTFVKTSFSKHLNLDQQQIRLWDNFMELGGYSLLAMSLLEDIVAKYGICMPVFLFIEDSSVLNVCRFIQTNRKNKEQIGRALTLGELPTKFPDRIPISYTQEELFYLHESHRLKTTYNEFIAVELEGSFHVPLLQTALDDLINTHLILRTTFHLKEKEFFQKVHPSFPYKLQILQTSSKEIREALIQNIQHEFSLDSLPLFRFKLFIMNESNSYVNFSKRVQGKLVLLLVIHHILIDGLSLYKLVVELLDTYHTYSDTSAKLNTATPVQYVSFALQERSTEHRNNFQNQLEYWKAHLDRLDPLHIMPDMDGSSKQARAGQVLCAIKPETRSKLLEVSLAHNTSLFTTLLSGFAFLLSKYSQDQDDVTIATPMSLRSHITQGMDMIGPLMNVALIRTKFGLQKPLTQHTFSDFLIRMHQTVRDAMDNILVPLKLVVSGLHLDENRDAPFEDKMQALFVFHEHSKMLSHVKSGELVVREFPFYPELNTQAKSNFVLSLDLLEGGGLQARFAYKSSLYSQAFMKQFAQDFKQLLQFVAERPTALLSKFSLLSSEEYREIISLCTTPLAKMTNFSIPQVFYDQVKDSPHCIALEVENSLYTYSHLYQLISCVVPSITNLTHQQGSIIGICMRQSVSLIVGILSILFAGFGYVYLDPDLPTGRLEFMIQDANISTLLTDSTTDIVYNISKRIHSIINVEPLLYAEAPCKEELTVRNSNEICYILYTSGSTGRPKGVIVSQKNIIARCCLTPELAGQPGSRFCQFSSFSFDIYAYEFYCSLLNGSTLCVFDRNKYLAQLDLFASSLQRQYVEYMMLAPALCDILSKGYPRVFSSLQALMVSGDVLPPIVSNRILTQGPPQYFYNLHGITEVTVVDTIYTINNLLYNDVPIGRPLSNSFIFVVDKHMNLLPKGIVGEIVVGGLSVALGYLNNSDKTKEKFKTYHFSQDSSSRLFKSGDLGYLDFTNNFRFIGRSDWQIKLRGQRLELGEVERVGLECPGVDEFVAVCLREMGIPVSIVGCCTTDRQDCTDLETELTNHLRDKLAPYMLPSRIHLLKELPRGSTGKVDRNKLINWIETGEMSKYLLDLKPRPALQALYRSDEIVEQITQVYKSYFPSVGISMTSDFFLIGGNSILALQLITEINSRLGTKVSLREFFQNTTITALAKFICELRVTPLERNMDDNMGLSKQDILKYLTEHFPLLSRPDFSVQNQSEEFLANICNKINKYFQLNLGTNDLKKANSVNDLGSLIVQQLNFHEIPAEVQNDKSLPLLPTQRQFALAYLLNPKQAAFHIPICVSTQTPLNWRMVEEFFNLFIQSHTILRTVYSLAAKFSQEVVETKFPCVYKRIVLPPEQKGDLFGCQQVKDLINSEISVPLDIENSIPIKASFVDLVFGDKLSGSLIVLVLHHIASDGWSVNLLLDEFQNFIKLYPNYQLKQTNFLEISNSEDKINLQFWRDHLSSFTCPQFAPFVYHLTPPQSTPQQSKTFKSVLEQESVTLLQRTSGECGVTSFIALLSVCVYLFTFYLEPDMTPIILTPVSTRSTVAEKQHFGPSVNLLPIAIDFKDENSFSKLTFRDLTKIIQSIFYAALENSPIAYEEIHPFLKPNSLGLTKIPIIFSFDSNQLQTSLDLGKFGRAKTYPAFDDLPSLPQDFVFEVNLTDRSIEESLTVSEVRIKDEISGNILTQYNIFLESLCSHPDVPLSRLSALPSPYKEALLGPDMPSEYNNVVNLIYDISIENDCSVAFEFEEERITYGQFFAECYSFSVEIRKRLPTTLHRHRIVAIFMDLTIELLTSILSTLICDCTYVLVDPSLPHKRIQASFGKSMAIITTKQHKALCMDLLTENSTILVIERNLLEKIDVPNNLKFELNNPTLFVLPTSGSTGEPKFVAIPHRSLISRIHVKSHPLYLSDETILICCSLSFDILPLQFYSCLFSASKGVILHQNCLGMRLDKLASTIVSKGITYVNLATPVLHMLAKTYIHAFKQVRYIDVGGDIASPSILHNLIKTHPHLQLCNNYGPTEGTILCTSALLSLEDCRRGNVTIGSAVPNTRLLIVDKFLRQTPFGLEGELLISGAVMSEYLNLPDATNEKLVLLPDEAGNKTLYFRTGDKVQQRKDGKIEFLTRYDSQVKVDGQRVELFEIEHTLSQHPAIQQAIVFLKKRENSTVKTLVACVLSQKSISGEDLAVFAGEYLTPIMIPSKFYFFKSFPLTFNGKVDRNKLLGDISKDFLDKTEHTSPKKPSFVSQHLLDDVCAIWRQVLSLDEIPLTQPFHTLGGSSLLLVQLHYKLQQEFNVNLSLPEMMTHNTVWTQANWITNKCDTPVTKTNKQEVESDNLEQLRVNLPVHTAIETQPSEYTPLAVVGMSCKFPCSENKEAFHGTLLQGKDCIEIHETEEGYISAGGILKDPELFDADYFNISKFDAALMDPQYRLALQHSVDAIRDSALSLEQETVGVFIGCASNTYLPNSGADLSSFRADPARSFYLERVLTDETAANFISYHLNLTGPSLLVKTTCVSSLTALHLASHSLRAGECTAAIVGGVDVTFPQVAQVRKQEDMIFSPDGHCKSFDQNADGLVSGNGIGLLVVTSLDRALQRGYPVYCQVRGSAFNNDGKNKDTYFSPSLDNMTHCIKKCMTLVDSKDYVGSIEAHGAGTQVGDQIELEALHNSYHSDLADKIYLGSVKSNIGHLGYASGAAALCKSVLQLEKGVIYPSLHFSDWNKAYTDRHSTVPFKVASRVVPWTSGRKRLAAVNGLGQGGSNVHIILEEHTQTQSLQESIKSNAGYICPISAHCEEALKQSCSEMVNLIENRSDIRFESFLASVYNTTREFPLRKCFLTDNPFDLLSQLKQWLALKREKIPASNIPHNLVLILPGQGSHFPTMGLGLYLDSRIFRKYFDECANICRSKLNFELIDLLFSRTLDVSSPELQVYLLCLQVSLIKFLKSVGLTPAAIVGHSLGELSAATAHNVFTLEGAIQLVFHRSKLILEITGPEYGMAAVRVDEETGEKLSSQFDVSVAAINSPEQVVLSGEKAKLALLYSHLSENNVKFKQLQVPTAFHSKVLQQIVPEYRQLLSRFLPMSISNSCISTVTGGWVKGDSLSTPGHWENQLVSPVLFYSALKTAAQIANPVFLEVGPGNRLSSIVVKHFPKFKVIAPLLKSDTNYLETLKEVWESGLPLKWSLFGFFDDSTPKLRMFPYPFQQQLHSINDIELYGKPCNVQTTPQSIQQTHSIANSPSNSIPKSSLADLDRNISATLVHICKSFSGKILEGEHSNFDISFAIQFPGGSVRFDSMRGISTPETIYPIGCLSSIFTYVLFNIFLEAGRVSNSTKLADLLPLDFSVSELQRSITLFQLATHSSGLPFLPSRLEWDVPSLSTYSLSDLFSDFTACQLSSKPGEKYTYSVFGTALLTHALTAISDQSYEELIHSYIIQPLGLKSTFITASMRTLKLKHYQGHSIKGNKVCSWKCGEAFKFADGIFTNLSDLVTLSQYLTGHKHCDIPFKKVLSFMFQSDQDTYRFLSGITNGSSVWLAVDREWDTSLILACNTSLDNCKKLAKLTEFVFKSVASLYANTHSSGIMGSHQSLPSSLGEKQVVVLSGGSLMASDAPIVALSGRNDAIATVAKTEIATESESILETPISNSEFETTILDRLTAFVGADILNRSDVRTLQFSEMGLDSLLAISLAEQISQSLGKKVSFHLISEYSSVSELSGYLQSQLETLPEYSESVSDFTTPVLVEKETNNNKATKVSNSSFPTFPNAKLYHLFESSAFPIVIEPSSQQVNGLVDLAHLISDNSKSLKSLLLQNGALLFRNFSLRSADDFSAISSELSEVLGPSVNYVDGISPRTRILDKIYTSTEYPSKYDMSPHNELSYSPLPPSHISFFCRTPPSPGCGGQTPLMSSRDVLRWIPSGVLDEWKEKGLKYYWNLSSRGKGAGKSWQETYGTEERSSVENYLGEQNFQFEWRGDTLRTARNASVTRRHPITQEEVWFNHAILFHPSELPGPIASALKSFPRNEYPKHCTFTDSTEIPDLEINQVKDICHSSQVMFDWEKGDLLLLDNFLVAHGRKRFDGDRSILVAMFRPKD